MSCFRTRFLSPRIRGMVFWRSAGINEQYAAVLYQKKQEA